MELNLEWLVKMFQGSEKKEIVREEEVNEDDVKAAMRSIVAQLELLIFRTPDLRRGEFCSQPIHWWKSRIRHRFWEIAFEEESLFISFWKRKFLAAQVSSKMRKPPVCEWGDFLQSNLADPPRGIGDDGRDLVLIPINAILESSFCPFESCLTSRVVNKGANRMASSLIRAN
ncbi:hypothetical protein TNIN_121961 [Trichonephila inaurata madagascariensis]|uniref:Uncharacterized protein n=1 Tax=Trichonephila inaurata madagascariensis TaxID=2747483 RepID=A0A8X6WPK0_9ARAC|nr:hypothetical protein TNIN_121961 [Trichonephila inaurata madagascariensis]